MKIFEGKNVPIKSWCNNPEEGALDQARNLAALPFIYKQVCLMPDVHQGYGMPIGGVIACQNVIIPNAVGVDIGCGMTAVRAYTTRINIDEVKEILGKTRELIPVGFKHHSTPQEWEGFNIAPDFPIIQQELNSARKQLGTLGGGNHFIEIQKGSDDHIWFMIHSGSRNFGYKIARYYHDIAKKLCETWYSDVSGKGNDMLAFLPMSSNEALEYFAAVHFALDFARENRKHMMNVLLQNIAKYIIHCDFDPPIDVHHNYAIMEHHFGKNVMIHRKGAIRAYKGAFGIIPGSQGTSSYIVKGVGNPESFQSCSHGAGRKMSRTAARAELNLKTEVAKMESQGILHSLRGERNLDEASSAYKDIDTVMEEQQDLVDIEVELKPLGVIKG